MDKNEEGELYPLRSLHDFMTELDREWGRFRRASLIGIIISSSLIFLFLRLYAVIRRQVGFLWESFFLILLLVFVAYEIYLLIRQYRFFSRWEKRVGLLMHLEDRLMKEVEEKIEKQSKP